MAPFFPALLYDFTSLDFLGKTRKKYHFGEEQAVQIRTVAEEMLLSMREESFWIRKAYSLTTRQFVKEPDGYECVAMSLGHGVDLLQESYSEKGLLSESYMVEVLAGELLMRGYDAYNRYILEHTAQHVARYHFPGSAADFPLEMLPGLLENLTKNITCNAALYMQPKKSVVFVSELTQDEKICCQRICVGCSNMSCPYQPEENDFVRKRLTDLPLTYGYSRIFGRNTP